MSEELDVLHAVTQRLDAAAIPYMVTGSIAMSYYAAPRMTRDIDFVVALESGDIDRVHALFREDFYIDRDAAERAIVEKSVFNLIHRTSIVKVDFVIRKTSEYRQLEFSRQRRVTIGGQTVSMVTAEDLIISKLDWARESHSEMQLSDVRNLLASVPDLDHAYLREWTVRLGLSVLYREVGE